ncbi:MAG: iron export ABC transporter permease subunit FetB [Thermodesulfobacteriota bacterium]|nr:iron export ABC transporter permease subunit FetB [Thermodesulfobacteriota bacterium]
MITLSYLDLGAASLLVLALAGISFKMRLGLHNQLLISASRTVIQLLLVGMVLRELFRTSQLGWIMLMAFVMLTVAGRAVQSRQKRRLKGLWGYGIGTSSMFISSFAVTFFALTAVVSVTPWYTPQYAIPLLGMLLGNTMNGVSLGMNQLTQTAWQQKAIIEQRLLLGQDRGQAIGDIRIDSIRTGMIPIINSMATCGIVSLPGMMTGQILAGSPPYEAVKYQIMIMFLIAAGTGFGVMASVFLTSKHLFDERHRLRLDRLKSD